ncbi:hypothetical protein MUG87_14425 [Ectobacillus sp. JY-23]|uniref:hypothetical protein n=1 Tax=Ectobacillus sp. JY-23 TaxID=2933872 RepID=UPI001FF5D8B8|nr:hypothetical protein [Ectobacillus sp. JY-23]UOY91678.1 hypothetical protein MUG87_14425 [Ectobacillus sp. JY-23]
MKIVSLQEQETPICQIEKHSFMCRYTYRRAKETQLVNDIGQDYFSLLIQEGTLVFALCDGVSLSFCGDVAARYLGDILLDWLQGMTWDNEDKIKQSLVTYLEKATETGTKIVNMHPLPHSVEGILRDVLEEKRLQGSEAMYVCGRIDVKNGKTKVMIAYQGDSRFRLFKDTTELHIPQETFHTSGRWSSRTGCVGGDPHICIWEGNVINRIVVYSDGLARLDDVDVIPSDTQLESLILQSEAAPVSDDLCLLDISVLKGRL